MHVTCVAPSEPESGRLRRLLARTAPAVRLRRLLLPHDEGVT